MKKTTEIRNLDGALVAEIAKGGEIVIVKRGCETRIRFKEDGTIEVLNGRVKGKAA